MLANDEEAADTLSDLLRLCRALSLERTVREALLCAAAIAAHRGARHEAALLAGAATFRFEHERRMAAEDLVFRRIDDQLLAPVRQSDPRTWDAAARAAATLSDQEAIALALGVLEARPQQALATASDGRGVR